MTGKPRPETSSTSSTRTEDARYAPRLWQRVRRWLHRSLGARVPRPMPILLEDLYPPPARSVYRSVRAWEQNLLCALDDLEGAVGADTAAALAEDTRRLARALRRYLLLVQRLRYTVAGHASGGEAHALYPQWRKHRIGWSGGICDAVETLDRASLPFVGAEPDPTPGACETLRTAMTQVAEQTRQRTAALDAAFRDDAGSARRPS